MKTIILPPAIVAVILFSLSAWNSPMPSMKRSDAEKLRTDMRVLWEDHVTWTRNVIFNIIDGLPGTEEAVKRLQKNQDDIGNAIKPYYGGEAGNKLATLLHTHISQAADILKALKVDDKATVEKLSKQWNENADEISAFLAKANPNWKLEDMKKMMRDHLTLTTDEAVKRHTKDYAGDVAAYEKVHQEILEMSDMLADGIIKQYPEKFKMEGGKTMGQNK